MAKVRQEKIVSSLPSTLTADTLYYVRVGDGFDLYLTNNAGKLVAYKLNKPYGNLTDFRSEFAEDGYIYAGYILKSFPVITRRKSGVEEKASDLTDLETDWENRLNLNYS